MQSHKFQNKQLTLLDLVLKNEDDRYRIKSSTNSSRYDREDTHHSQYNQLGISLYYDANITGNEQFVSNQLFRSILKNIEEKLLELETRIDNKDHLTKFTFQIDQLKHQQNRNPFLKDDYTWQEYKRQDSQISEMIDDQSVRDTGVKFQKASRSRSTCTNNCDEQLDQSNNNTSNLKSRKNKITEESTFSKLNLFEKKLSQFQDQFQKQLQKEEISFKKLEQQVQAALKDAEMRLLQNTKSMDKYTESLNNYSDYHKEFLTKLSQLTAQINNHQQEINRLSDDQKIPFIQLESTIAAMNRLQNIHNDQILSIKESYTYLEADILAIMKNYKDLILDKQNKSNR
ncbi:unnamed protein product (macronuclear) [Paramecium tetraurelia]|uniref:Uncharacterized protein n=1 Tax=Paramecium tetraurelia TaxID=5888 RepID=A0E0P1_PARTE|nr:uncharacterized protein GSPATT00022026001 [Paramecium tetraurelia]CAK88858.1 unnamed protein product [Paramecium tetraurelia]|eukprot:XP_001456255.1 hypothetical protein (macronuclear) [Paramecium tetraurelia strain d4-2]